MAANDPNDDRREVGGADIHVRFHRLGDRWTHDLAVGPEAAPTVVAVAIEADPDRDVPERVVSPTYQEFALEGRGASVVTLLVGQSGKHHFSAVVAIREGDGPDVIEVDVADRCRGRVESLAVTYRVNLPADALRSVEDRSVSWETPDGRLDFEAEEPGRVILSEAGRRTLVQAEARIDPNNHTQRCLYRWRWTPDRPNPGARP